MKSTNVELDTMNSPQQALQRYLDDLLLDVTYSEATEEDESITSSEDVAVELEVAAHASEAVAEIDLDEQLDLSFAEFEAAIQGLQDESSDARAESKPVIENRAPSVTMVQERHSSEVLDTVSFELPQEVDALEDVVDENDPSQEIPDSQAELEVGAHISDLASVVQQDSAELPAIDEKELEQEFVPADITIESEAPVAKPQIAKTDPLPWAQSRFECLLFYVGGLKMAVPLVELGGIYQANKDNVTNIFGQPSWYMGVANVGEFNIRTVDTARWVMPDHYVGELKDNFKFVIQLDRSDWGLACEKVAEAISLEPSQVKWRSDRSRRPWLAGTVIDHMCAILDVQGFIELLDDPNNGYKMHVKG
ncbi:chemotaxis protein CheW [Maribrevibacterium harenarium]|uniref:Chemotaxis protein CheW n=1 Tax=Maribrevibacterium harenarium TaxID=2589817 RepID=A0A501X2P8_9GAMM|nr:chemotaxis protein CheW [Maribrevibacterium harenarium]TPE54723.1 chemotaxis protein CheW [Maribrevibacterium harenarium]